jgi:nucleoside-diphosphate-sugar epimerase
MRVLAIGATGFIGPHVVRRLVELGHEVAVMHRGGTKGSLPSQVQHIFGDRDFIADVRPELEKFGPAVVLDVIPYTERQARELVGALRGLVERIVAVSSSDVCRNFDGFHRVATTPPDPVPLAEDAPLRESLYPYRGHDIAFQHRDEYEKILVERVVLGESEPQGTVLRLPAVYGPGDKQHRLRPYLQRMDAGRSFILLGQEEAGWCWTRGYVANVACAVALAVNDRRAAGRVYNVGEQPAPTEREWVGKIGAAVGWAGDVVTVPADRLPKHLKQPFDWRYNVATDTRRIREELAYDEPVSPQEALERTVEWERSLPPDELEPLDYAAEDDALTCSRGS